MSATSHGTSGDLAIDALLPNPHRLHDRNNLMAGTGAWKYVEGMLALMYWIAGWFVMSVVVFLRRDFGERYLSWLNLCAAWSVVFWVTALNGFLVASLNRGFVGASALFTLFILGFVGTSLYHRWKIAERNRIGPRWHSMYSGTSHLQALVPFSEETVKRFVDPGAVFIVSIPIFLIQPMLGIWLIVCGFAMLFSEQYDYQMRRNEWLDRVDNLIEAEFWSDAFAGKPVEETRGVVVPRSTVELIQQVQSDPRLTGRERAVRGLDPRLQAMMGIGVAESPGSESPGSETPAQTA